MTRQPECESSDHHHIRFGLRANLPQFVLLVLITSFIGGMVGAERSVVADIAKDDFGIGSTTIALSFIMTFGIAKALANLLAGGAADQIGRKGVLVLGWLIAVPVPFLVMFAPNWWWIVGANLLLGLNQGLAWSVVIAMKMDLVGSNRRGTAIGINEFTGYASIAVTAVFAGWLATQFGTRPVPFFLPAALAVLGVAVSVCWVRDTHPHVQRETALQSDRRDEILRYPDVVRLASWRHPTLRSAAQAGLVTKMNDALVWGLVPLMLAADGISLGDIALIAAIYPASWGIAQLGTGMLSDYLGRKWLIVLGMAVQSAAILLFIVATGFAQWILAAAALGLGAALTYPTLLAVVGDVAEPRWRASTVGVYRLWRDSGFIWGALLAGLLTDGFGFNWAIRAMALVSFVSSLYVAYSMTETRSVVKTNEPLAPVEIAAD